MSFLRVPLSKSPSLDLLKTAVTCHVTSEVTSVYSSWKEIYTKLKVNDRSLSSKFQWPLEHLIAPLHCAASQLISGSPASREMLLHGDVVAVLKECLETQEL